MKNLSFLLLGLLFACSNANKSSETTATAETKAAPVFFELRTYYAAPDKLDDLLTRFRDHTVSIFEKYDIVNMGYWLPIDNTENKLIYLVGFESREQRDASWKAFFVDPDWEKAYAASRADGPLVDSVKSVFLNYADFSPQLKQEDGGPRIFSMRTYHTNENKLESLKTRFREHTLDIFEANGMQNVAYFDLAAGQEGAENTFVYMIAFPDTTARKAAWESFSEDENWKSAYANSIKDGKLVESIDFVLLNPTDFSPLK
jgi:hypothetical protein